ncbi:MAG: PDZ domain-containing protein [Phycisphaerae bacterium]|nr:PDZ domain-containing protein [Phycisphaerae bacterium]
MRTSFLIRLLLCGLCCPAVVSAALGQETRYLAVFADGRRVSGDELSGWGVSPAEPRLGETSLADPKRPLRWFQDRSLRLWKASECTLGFVEFVGGDRIVGQVTGSEQGDRSGVGDAGMFLRVHPAHLHEMPSGMGRTVVRVYESAVKRIVWTRQPHRTFQPSMIFLRGGGRLKYTSLRWFAGGIRVLLENGVRRIMLSELAELHMPRRDHWKAYFRELAILNPKPGQALFRLETSDGVVLTCSPGRFRSAAAVRNRKLRKKGPPDRLPECWYHLVQPAWSVDAIWLPFKTIATRTYFAPHELPLARLAPDRVVQKSMTGFSWRWRSNRNVRGDRLMVGGQAVSSGGLGVHANNELTFTLPAFARSFRTRLALDAAAGRGGCARGLIHLDSTKNKPLYRSDAIVGSNKILDSGELKLSPAKDSPRRLILVADAAHADRPADADPLDIRDMLDWIDPIVKLDPRQLRAAVVRSVLDSVPAWRGWDVSLSGEKFVPLSSQWDASNPARARFVHALDLGGRRLTLTARRRIGPKQRWLKIRARQVGPPTNPGRIEVRLDGRLAAYLPVCRAGYDSPYLVPLDAYKGKEVTLQIVCRPGGDAELIDWLALAIVERKTAADWTPLRTVSAVSQRGVKLDVQPDGSILAIADPQEVVPALDTYCIRAETDLPRVAAIRLEALADSSLRRGGPGREARSVLSQFRVSTAPTLRNAIRGQYVRLSLPGKETCLHVSEVQVFAPPPTENQLLTGLAEPETPENLISPNHKTADILAILKIRPAKRDLEQRTVLRSYRDAISRNIALGAEASQSTTVYSCKAAKAVDGRLEGGYTHTDQEQSPWWLLDLGAQREIDRIVVWNREDGNGYSRMTGLVVEVLDSKQNVIWRRTERDPGAPASELFDSDSRKLIFSSAASSSIEPGLPAAGASLQPTASGWSIATRFGESHAVEFALTDPVDVRRTGLDIKMKQAYVHSYPVNFFSDGNGRLRFHDRRRIATLGRFRLLATADQPPAQVEPVPVVVKLFDTSGSEKADASVALTSPHPLFEDSARFEPVKSADRSKLKLISDDRHAGARAVRIAPSGKYRMNLGRMISIRAKPSEGQFRYIRFAFRKYGSGRVSLQFGGLAAHEYPCRYDAGVGTPVDPIAQSVWAIDLPPEWIVLDRDLFGDFGRLDLTSLTIACTGGSHAVFDHIYLARSHADFKRLPPAPSPEETNLKARRVLAGPILKKGFPAVVLVKVGDQQAGGVLVGEEGYVMTVGHLLVGGGDDASIRLPDGRTVRGKIAGVYRSADVGLVKITDKGPWKGLELTEETLHPRGGLYVGFSFARSFKGGKAPTSYITDISDSGYWTYQGGFTQKDAIVGGPLLDARGRIVGVHNQMPSGGGMRFSRLHSVRHEWRRLKRGDKWNEWLSGSGPMLGFHSAIRRGGCGVAIVYPNTPAAAAGMKPGDLITHIDNDTVDSFETLVKVLTDKDPGREVTVVFKRGSQTLRKKIRLMRRIHYPR